MKKILSIVFVFALVIGLAGCNKSWDDIFVVSAGEKVKNGMVLEGQYYSVENTTNNTYKASMVVEFSVVENYKELEYTDEIQLGTLAPHEIVEFFLSHERLVSKAGHEWSYARSITTRPVVVGIIFEQKN